MRAETCYKHRFPTWRKAERSLRVRGRQERGHGVLHGCKLSAYKCQRCGGWHVGSRRMERMRRSA